MAWCLTPAWLFIALRSFMSAINRPEPALWITLGAIPANALLAYVLIYGARRNSRARHAWAPDLPPRSSTSACFSPACGSATRGGRFANFTCSAASGASDWALLGKLVLIGLPISADAVAGTRPVRRRVVDDGHDRNQRAGRASDRAADCRDRVHGAARHFVCLDRAGRPRGRPARRRRRTPRRPCGDHSRHRLSGRDGGLRRRKPRDELPIAVPRRRRLAGDGCDRVDAAV